MTRVAILNSRQSKTPVGNDPWVKQTLAAVEHAARESWTVVSSVGLNTWELVTWAAGQRSAKLELIIPSDISNEQFDTLLYRFDLESAPVSSIRLESGVSGHGRKGWWEARDRELIARCDTLMPVSLRQGGQLDQLMKAASHARIDERFRIKYSPTPHHLSPGFAVARINPVLNEWGSQFLVHWTRACHGPWPDETEARYYSVLTKSADIYCHSGYETLRRILAEQRVRGSSWKIGSGASVVAFTELPPHEARAHMRWRSRWARWSFEPYGIAIDRAAAEGGGIRPVRYIDEKQWKNLPDDDKPYCHRIGKTGGDWQQEREWRCPGDFLFGSITTESLRIIVKTRDDVARLQPQIGHQVVAMFE